MQKAAAKFVVEPAKHTEIIMVVIEAKKGKTAPVRVVPKNIFSFYLERDVLVDLYLPPMQSFENLSLLLINDGQDLRTMQFVHLLDNLLAAQRIQPLVCVGIHCSADRIDEYAIAYRTDYKGRGTKAGMYQKFIFDELLPMLEKELSVSRFADKSFAGFSMGGLSALDMVWNHPHEFVRAGVFSGSMWWRRRGYDDADYDYDRDRIMHLQVQRGKHRPWLQFFFECGQLDETADRNNNGIIDAIEDVTDLIEDMKRIGYTSDQIRYLELPNGRHNIETWARAFPVFLVWGWGTGEPGE